MALHEMHDLPDGGTVRVAIRRPKRDKRERQGSERPLPHLGNKQKRRQDYDASSFQPSTVQKTEEVQATPVDESTNQTQTQSFFTTQESIMTQAANQADQTTAQTAAAEQIKDIKKEVQETTKKEEKSSAWKTAGKVVGGIAAVAGLAAGGYFAWKKYSAE
jgi:hypothetical protein